MYVTCTCHVHVTGWALCGHETPNVAEEPDQQQSCGGDETASNNNAAPLQDMNGIRPHPDEQVAQQRQAQRAGDLIAEAATGSDNHVVNLTSSARMQLGQKCKRLIDFGRQQWLSSQGFQVLLLLLCNVSHKLCLVEIVVQSYLV